MRELSNLDLECVAAGLGGKGRRVTVSTQPSPQVIRAELDRALDRAAARQRQQSARPGTAGQWSF